MEPLVFGWIHAELLFICSEESRIIVKADFVTHILCPLAVLYGKPCGVHTLLHDILLYRNPKIRFEGVAESRDRYI